MSFNYDPGPEPETFELIAFYLSIWMLLVMVCGPWWGTIGQLMVTTYWWADYKDE